MAAYRLARGFPVSDYEAVGEDRDTAQDRVTIQEAARRLGVKEDAIRKRIQRGSMQHEKTREGRVFVWVDTTQDTARDAYQDASRDALLAAKDETITTLREQLAQAYERDRENRRIIAALTQRIPAIEAPPESPSDTTPEAPTEATEQPGRVEPQPQVEGAQETGERRSWWQRWFGA